MKSDFEQRVIENADSRKEIVQIEDGTYYFFPTTGTGCMSAAVLRVLADELDNRSNVVPAKQYTIKQHILNVLARPSTGIFTSRWILGTVQRERAMKQAPSIWNVGAVLRPLRELGIVETIVTTNRATWGNRYRVTKEGRHMFSTHNLFEIEEMVDAQVRK